MENARQGIEKSILSTPYRKDIFGISSLIKYFGGFSAKGAWVENAALALWIFAVVASTLTHELWRDETREYLMALETDSFADFFNFAKYDGHPLLWRTILMVLHRLVPYPMILQMASLAIGYLTVHLLVKKSPFPLLIKVLFIFGVVPFSTNTVDARDYGISMLLFFVLALLYSKTERHPLLIGIALFFEANSNQYGMYLSGLFLAGWIADQGFAVLKDRRFLTATIIALAGIFISFYSTRVDAESVFCPPEYLARINFAEVFVKALRHPGEFIYYILNIKNVVYRDIFVIALIFGTAVVRPYLGIAMYLAVFFFNFVAIAFIYPQTHHQGVLLGFIVSLLWVTLAGLRDNTRPGLFRHARAVFYVVLAVAFLPFLIHQVKINNAIARQEARVVKSSALAVGEYILANRQLKDAIIVGSPDYSLEPIAYYSGTRLFLVQENVFRDFVKFSRDFQKTHTLPELLKKAEELNADKHVPILIVLAYFDMKEGTAKSTIYRGNFLIKEVENFREKTIKLAEFNNSLGDENYQVFLYLPHDELLRYKAKYMEFR